MSKKNSLLFFLTLIIEGVITFLVASAFSVRFIEVMGILGAVICALIYLLTSGGGSVSDFFTARNAAITGIIQKRESFVFKRGPVFFASLVYFGVGLIFFILLVSSVIPPA
ncbi:hypothetical protein [Ureibacillus acetophenoni]|uniref:Uncharacterized protein n=1 Tax=Ureibacillus acetophenoni TaxID=614649 RepID=A0A285UI33_9BACL|nr:hypothetical protein [Ureibacillus acetophenoni]SOC41540.1 hypothetical protein SAMN05877842_110151 [Ureibacillus acetophenoni]